MDVSASPVADPGMPGDWLESLAADPVDPMVPAGDPAMSSDGSELSTAEQGMLVSEPAATSPPGIAAAHTPRRQLAIHIRDQNEDVSRRLSGRTGALCQIMEL